MNLFPFYASHHFKQVCCLTIQFIVFCQRIVECADSISFLNVCYFSFGLLFFSNYKEDKHSINLYGSP